MNVEEHRLAGIRLDVGLDGHRDDALCTATLLAPSP